MGSQIKPIRVVSKSGTTLFLPPTFLLSSGQQGWKKKHREKLGEFLAQLQKSLYLCTNRSGYQI
jgi:hypothetical protein